VRMSVFFGIHGCNVLLEGLHFPKILFEIDEDAWNTNCSSKLICRQ